MSFYISKNCNLKKDTLQFLYEKNTNEESSKISEVFGGILSNLHYAWLVRKSRIVVINCKSALRVGSWDFGNTLQDDTAEINKVEEIQRPNGKEPHLIISLNCETRGGMICIFDFVGSKVIRAINIVENITSVHVVDRGQDLFSLSGPLRNFDGVLAIGTVGGNVYILDICRQLCYEGFNSFEARDEMNPCDLKIITAGNLLDLENCKKIALCNESHLAIFLNVVQNKKTEHFVLKGPGGSDVLYVNEGEVLISSLHYCPQLSSILVGYNFGAFQLWDLMNMELVYTSSVCEDHIPIIRFAIQEPADDPRAFCYVWAVYDSEELESKVLPNMVMYALCYESKEYHENYGILYENFQYCTIRFQKELGFGNSQCDIRPIGGKFLDLDSLVLKNSCTNTEIYGSDGTEDALSLCAVAWSAVCESGQNTYMSIFDLNQWYKAQMPNSSNHDDCYSYMLTVCISDLINADSENKMEVFDVNLNKKTIQQFIGTQRLEEHYYPSSLSFEISCLLEHKIVNIQNQGVQTALLWQLQKAGPLCLIRPSDTYQEIVALGLSPLFVELNTTSPITSLNNQREVILSVALEQQLTSWLCKCASEWANGSFSSAGCSLDLLISWAHRRVITLKQKCDHLCIPMFDCSDFKLDTNTINVLSNCIRQIKNISFLFSYILAKFSSFLTNKDTISELCNHLKMVDLYFDVLQWFFNVGLLPEFTPQELNISNQENKLRAPYPIKEMEEYYMSKRSDLVLSGNKRFSIKNSVLFIDNLISVEFGDGLVRDWRRDGGNGLYPPRSLQALLRTYLLDGIEVYNKHTLLIYLLSDLAVLLDSQHQPLITNLMKFPAVYKVSPSHIKITHAFWQLDHGGCHHAMEQLLDPMVNQEDLRNWHHKVVLKSLLLQEQHNLALLYMNVRKPPIVDDEDVLCALSLFVSNNMLDEAFYLEKNFSNYSSSKIIIKHLFKECGHYGRLGSIIYRNLTPAEETQFLKYLDEVKHPDAADLKITYFMQRSHYKEAFNTYKACEDDPTKKGLLSRLNLKARDQIVHSYKKFLPTVSYDFIENCTREPNSTIWKEVSRPNPMSVSVHRADTKTEYKSSMILAALAKAKLTFSGNANDVSILHARTEELPFLRTPTATPSQKRSSVQVIIPKIVVEEVDEEEDGPSPPKISRLSFSSPPRAGMNSSILNTPIIVRKKRNYVSPIGGEFENITTTPASILKVRSTYNADSDKISTPVTPSVTPLRTTEHKSFISGRKSTRTSIVRFDVPSSSPEDQSSSLRSPIREIRTPERNESISFETSSKSVSPSTTSKNISDTDETFYSPNSSLNNIEELSEDTSSMDKNEAIVEQPAEAILKISPEKPAVISKAELVKIVDYNLSSSEGSSSSSPKGRRSYRKSASDTSVRSSPRLTRGRDSTASDKITNKSLTSEDNSQSPSKFPTGRSRKSLNRQVLEANTLARIAVSTDNTETTRTRTFTEETEISNVVVVDKNSEISQTKIEYADSYTKTSSHPENILEKHSVSTTHSYTAETTLDSDSGESFHKLNHDWTLGVSDSILRELEEDLRQRSSQAAASNKKGIATEQTPLRNTKTTKRTSSFVSHEQSPDVNKKQSEESKDSQSCSQRQSCRIEEEKHSTTSVETSTSSTSLKTTRKSSRESVLFTGSGNDQIPSPREQSTSKPITSSTPHLRSSQESNKNRTKRSKHPLSRRVLENNALSRLISEYETSSNEDMEVDKEENSTEDTEMTEDSEQVADKQSNISVSDSMLEMLGFGALRRERELMKSGGSSEELNKFVTVETASSSEKKTELISERSTWETSDISTSGSPGVVSAVESLQEKDETNSVPLKQKQSSTFGKDESNAEKNDANQSSFSLSDSVMEILTSGKVKKEKNAPQESLKSPNPTEHYDIDKASVSTEVSECRKQSLRTTTKGTSEAKDLSVSEACSMIYDDLDEESNQNEELDISEDLDQAFILQDSTTKIETKHTVYRRDLSDNEDTSSKVNQKSEAKTEVIEISSSESKSSTSSSNTSETSTSDDYSHKKTSQNNYEQSKSVIFISESNSSHKSESKGETGPENFESEESENKEKDNSEEQKDNKTEQPEAVQSKSGRRSTRRSSKLAESQDEIEEISLVEEVENVETSKSRSARRVSLRRSSQSSEPTLDPPVTSQPIEPVPEEPVDNRRSIGVRKRPRSVDTPVNTQVDDSKTKTSEPLRARRKLRSASVDIPSTISEESKKETRVVEKFKRRPSVTGFDDKKEDEKTLEAIKEELVENYRKDRRLTRRQANILERSMNKVLPSMDKQDPIELLDRSDCEGTSDPQEQRAYETSPSSTASVTRSNKGRPARRLSRASSNASDDSVISNKSTTSRRKNLGAHADSPTPSVTRRKLRSASTEENPESKSPEQIKDKVSDIVSGDDDSAESDTSIISTRSKKSTKSDSNNSTKTRKRKIAAKSVLPEIREENSEAVSGSPAQNTRRGRKTVQK